MSGDSDHINSSSFSDLAVDDQNNQRAHDRPDNAWTLAVFVKVEHVTQESRHKRAGDAQKNGHDNAQILFSRQDEARHGAGE